MAWLTGWDIRYKVTVTENSGSALSNHQVGEISLQGNNPLAANYIDFTTFNSDGSDLRITKADGETLESYWLRDWDNGAKTAKLYFKASSLTASSNNTFYLYGDNNGASSASSYTNTMIKYPFDDSGLLALYQCDSLTGGGQIIDSSPNGFDSYFNDIGLFGSDGGNFAGDDTYSFSGDCLEFPDTGNPFVFGPYALVAHDNAWNALVTAGTVMAWSRHAVVNRHDPILIKAANGYADRFSMFRLDKPVSSPFRGVLGDGTNTEIVTGITTPVANTWYFNVFTWDSSTSQIWTNGVKEDELARSISIATNSNDIGFGRNPGYPGPGPVNQFFHEGQIDLVSVLTRKLLPGEIDAAWHRRRFASTQPTWVFGSAEMLSVDIGASISNINGFNYIQEYGVMANA